MRTLLRQVFGAMPREFANPKRRVVEDFEKLCALLDQYNKRTKCYVGAYAFATDERSYSDVVINKAVFDFDGAWDELVGLHGWLNARDVAHFCVFSGSDGSGHVYVLTKPTRHQQSLEYFQRDIVVDRAGLRKCNRCGNPVDKRDPHRIAPWYCRVCDDNLPKHATELVVDGNLIGDPSTCIRVPNTYHTGADRYCIPLRPEEVTRDVEAVYELAEGRRDLELADVVSGSRTVGITQHRERAEELYQSYSERQMPGLEADRDVFQYVDAEIEPAVMMENLDCTCVRRLITDESDRLTNPPLGHAHRRILVSKLVELGYNPAEIRRFLRWALAEDKAEHSINDEEQPVRIWRDGVKAPNKSGMKREGIWREDCPEHGHPQLAGVEGSFHG